MNFDFTDDQHEIKRTARDLLTKRSTWEKVREAAEGGRYDLDLWRELGELGWPGIAITEEHGGQGLGVVELVILLEELGFALRRDAVPGDRAGGARDPVGRLAGAAGALAAGLASGELRGALGAPGLIPDGDGADVLVLVTADGMRLVRLRRRRTRRRSTRSTRPAGTRASRTPSRRPGSRCRGTSSWRPTSGAPPCPRSSSASRSARSRWASRT